MSIITIQTLATNSDNNKIALDYLEEYGGIFGQATHTAFSKRNRIGKTKTTDAELEKQICKELETQFGLSNSEAKNVYNKAAAVYASQSECWLTAIRDVKLSGNTFMIGLLKR